MNTRWLRLLAFILVLSSTSTAGAQETVSAISDWSAALDELSDQLDQADITDESLSQIRDELEGIRDEARQYIADQRPDLDAARGELDALGPPPSEGAQPEPEGIAAYRQEVTDRLAQINGPIEEAELVITRVNDLIGALASLRRNRFAEQVLTRGVSPLSPAVWRRAAPEFGNIVASVSSTAREYFSSAEFRERLRESAVALLAAIIFAIILVWPVYRWLIRRYGPDQSVKRPSFLQAVQTTLLVGTARALLPTIALGVIYLVIISENLFSEAGNDVAGAVFAGIVAFVWTLAFFRASFSPTQPNWRIVPVPTKLAKGIRGVVVGLALVIAVDLVLSEIILTFDARLAVTVLRDIALAIIISVLLLSVLLKQHIWIPEGDEEGTPRWRSLRTFVAVALIIVLILGAFGYVALARLVATQFVLTGGLLLVMLILHRLGREVISQAISTETWVGERMRTSLQMDESTMGRFEFWTRQAYDISLVLVTIVVGLFVWGADQADIYEWVYQALFGFSIGQITFSLVDLCIAIALFVGLVIVTRIIQRALAEKILPQTQLDSGIRESIRIATGYVGIVIAAAVGVSALGLDLSNLAIIAGALSVGIGFGLQNVVNNFVSGLILLVERPVKVGDWVVVGDKQGYIKRIKVRATEIQTFDRASLFVPNSQLISEAVTNWTFADKMGRVIVPIGVAYGSDTHRVRELLLEIAKEHPQVLKDPAPSALFRGFGDSALNFELRCFLHDVEKTIGVTSDLCFAIDDTFRKEHIEIPFPQQDVHLTTAGALNIRSSSNELSSAWPIEPSQRINE